MANTLTIHLIAPKPTVENPNPEWDLHTHVSMENGAQYYAYLQIQADRANKLISTLQMEESPMVYYNNFRQVRTIDVDKAEYYIAHYAEDL